MAEGDALPEVGPHEARDLVDEGAFLLDVREPDEWQAGHAPPAVHVPLGALEAQVDDVPRDRRVVVVCRMGGRSAVATSALRGLGLDAVNLAGGMQGWEEAGFPVVTDDGGPGRVV